MHNVLVYSERDELAHELVSGAISLNLGPVSVCLLGQSTAERATGCFEQGATRVYTAESLSPADLDSEAMAALLMQVGLRWNAEVFLLGSTRRGKELAGRLAQKIGAGCITDVIAVDCPNGDLRAHRYALGGSTVVIERILTDKKVISVMPKTFELRPAGSQTGELVSVAYLSVPGVQTVERRPKSLEAVDLEKSERIVGVGKGLRAKEDLALVEALAKALNAEVGCTRALAADLGWMSEDRLIGLSGRKPKPRLYLALGISGQVQHTVGVTGARTIVAINSDKNAPIFQVSDYGIVGDLYQIVPQIVKLLA